MKKTTPMIPTISFVQDTFEKFNKLYFNNQLPMPKFSLKKAHSFYGCFYAWKASSTASAKVVSARHGLPHGELAMSIYFDRPKLDVQNTILHEMVHLWQFWNELPHGHGSDFKRKGAELSRDGWEIVRVGGHASACAEEVFNRLSTPVPSRKKAALLRSINHLQSLSTLTPAQQKTLSLRLAEYNS